MGIVVSAKVEEDFLRRLTNWQIREKRGNRSEAVRILLESALNAAEAKQDDRLIALGDLSPEQRDGIRALLDELDRKETPRVCPKCGSMYCTTMGGTLIACVQDDDELDQREGGGA